MDEQKMPEMPQVQEVPEVPNAEPEEISKVVQFAKDCNIIPAGDGRIGHSEDVIYVETTRIVDGEEVKTKELFTKDNIKIGYVDLTTGAVVFEEAYRDKLKELLGEQLYEQLGLDDRQIKMEEILNENQFVEVTLDKEIDGLSKEEIEAILMRYGSKEIKDKIKALKEEQEVEKEPEDPEKEKSKIAKDMGIKDERQIESIDYVKDRAACAILQKGNDRGYPLQIKMLDGEIKYAKRNLRGEFEDLNVQNEMCMGEMTNYIREDGRVESATVLTRIKDPNNKDSVAMIKTSSGEVKTVVERTAYDEAYGHTASISREMVTGKNSNRLMSGNVRDLVDGAEKDDIIAMQREVDNETRENPQNTININDMASVDSEYKKGDVQAEQLGNSKDEIEEAQQDGSATEKEERTQGGDALGRLYGGYN